MSSEKKMMKKEEYMHNNKKKLFDKLYTAPNLATGESFMSLNLLSPHLIPCSMPFSNFFCAYSYFSFLLALGFFSMSILISLLVPAPISHPMLAFVSCTELTGLVSHS